MHGLVTGVLKMGAGGFVTVAVAIPCEQAKLNAQFCVAVTVTPDGGIVPNCIMAVSICGPVLAIMVAPAGNGVQLMGDVVTVDVA